MGTNDIVLPALKPYDWPHYKEVVCRPLVSGDKLPALPWVVFGYDRPNTFEFLARRNFPQEITAEQLSLIEQAAIRNLKMRPVFWTRQEFNFGGLGALEVLVCSEDFLAAERILDSSFMQQAHRQLNAEMLAVGIPRRGLMIAVNAKQSKEMVARFAGAISAQYHRADSAPITPTVLVVTEGNVVGAVKGMEEAGKRMAEAEEQESSEVYISTMASVNDKTGVATLHILAGSEHFDKMASSILRAFVGGTQKLMQRGGEFNIEVIIIPDITPDSSGLRENMAALEERLRGVAAEAGIRTESGKLLEIHIMYGHEAWGSPTTPGPTIGGSRE